MKLIFLLSIGFFVSQYAISQPALAGLSSSVALIAPPVEFYRDLTNKIRASGEFLIPTPGAQASISYQFELDRPVLPIPMVYDSQALSGDGGNSVEKFFYRVFWDRILFKDGSFLLVNGEKLPLTCVFVEGQDNRYSDRKLNPLLPEFVIKIYLVANDFSCQGPIKPGWPATGGREENWDTYLYYVIKDPTIMLPMDAKLRYRWNEYSVVLKDGGKN